MDPNQNQFVPAAQPTAPGTVSTTYGKWDFWVAVSALVFGYLFCRAFPFSAYPLGAALLLLALTVVAAVATAKSKKWKGGFAVATTIFLAVTGVSLPLQGGSFSRFLTACLFFFLFFYSLARNFGVVTEPRLEGNFFADAVIALFVLPFRRLAALFPALFRSHRDNDEKKRRTLRTVLWVALGLLISLVPASIAAVLLSYDEGFRTLLGSIFDFQITDLFRHVGSFILGIPLAMALFSAFFCASRRLCNTEKVSAGVNRFRTKSKFLPVSLTTAVFVPLLLVYLLFFLSQKEYYFSAFHGQLPVGISYANFAREGFFNLCAVAVLNALFLLVMHFFTKKKENGESSAAEKTVSVLFALFTLLLIVTAMAKMVMYVSEYGLTMLRVFASWWMLFLFVIFLCVVVRQFWKKMNLTAVLCAVVFLFWAVIGFSDVRAVIAEYNADAYLSGRLTSVDLNEIYDMGDSGVPALVRLAQENAVDKYGTSAAEYLSRTDAYRRYALQIEDSGSIFSLDVARLRAKIALEKAENLPLATADRSVCIHVDTEEPIQSVYLFFPAQNWGEGVEHADGTLIRMDELFVFDLPFYRSQERFDVEATVTLEDGTSAGVKKFTGDAGEMFSSGLILHGSRESGFWFE